MKLLHDDNGCIIGTATDEYNHGPSITAPDEWDGNFEKWRIVDGIMVPAVPTFVTRRQAKIAMLQTGLLDKIVLTIDTIEDITERRIAQIEWEEAQEFRRDWPLLNKVAAMKGITDNELDELFILAGSV